MSKFHCGLILFFVLLSCTYSLKFCSWHDENSKLPPRHSSLSTQTPDIVTEPFLTPRPDKHKEFIGQEQFRSYHPHYLHSYSYPRPITPHLFIGQQISDGRFAFLVKYNQSLTKGSLAGQLLYVNGKKQYGNPTTHEKTQLRSIPPKFLLVLQMENMLSEKVKTSISVKRERTHLSLVCQSPQKTNSYILSVVNQQNSPVSLFQQNPHLAIKYHNFSTYSNQDAWKISHHGLGANRNQILFSHQQGKVQVQALGVQIEFKNWNDLKQFKIGVWEIEEKNQPQGIWDKLDSIQFQSSKFTLQKIVSSFESCQSKSLNQLIQGLSYEYGTLQLKNGSQFLHNAPKPLLSLSPSRKRFPWGFLWDDGFHCQILSRHNPTLTLKIIKSWLDTMEDNGWIPREQNRGKQRQLLCSCPRFMAKDIKDGNPPTLVLGLGWLARNNLLDKNQFAEYWPKMKKWYNWFLETQMNQRNSYVFKWHDSIQAQGASFNSGMDDFPRLPITTGHVDCQSWMYLFATSMELIGNQLGFNTQPFKLDSKKIKQVFMEKFLDKERGIPNDFYQNNEERGYNKHFGYPSLLPLAFGMIQENTKIYETLINALKQQLDSNYGLTSLSRLDPLYLENSDAYWRGPVWMNINYLVLRGLHLYYKNQQAKDLYKKLRNDLTGLVCGQQKERGYFFENYINGKGSFSYPFTGWTALIGVIINEKY